MFISEKNWSAHTNSNLALIFHIIITVKCRWKKYRSVLDSHAQKDRKCQIKQQIRGEKTILKRELISFFLVVLLLLKCQLRFLSVPISLRSYFVAIFFYYFLLLFCFCASKEVAEDWIYPIFFLYIVDSFVVRGAKLQVIGLEISYSHYHYQIELINGNELRIACG